METSRLDIISVRGWVQLLELSAYWSFDQIDFYWKAMVPFGVQNCLVQSKLEIPISGKLKLTDKFRSIGFFTKNLETFFFLRKLIRRELV